MPYNFIADSHHITLLFKQKAFSHLKRQYCVFEPPLGNVGATYDVHLRLIGKCMVDLLVLIELFSLCATTEALRVNINENW